MTPSETPTPAADRAALARALLDVICPPHLSPRHALTSQLHAIAGAAGYLACSATCKEFEVEPLPEHLAGIGAIIETAAKIALCLNDAEAAP